MNELPAPDHVIDIDLPKVTKSGILWTIGSFILLIAILVVVKGEFSFTFSLWGLLLFIIGYVALIVLHEAFHLLGFRIFGGVPWKRMVVGVNLKLGIAYATTDKPMTNSAIRKALLLPFWTTGIVPGLIGLYLDSGILVGLAAFLIGGAAGDFAMYKELRKLPDDWLVKDDPERPKLYLYQPGRISDTIGESPESI
ncbi:diaminopimelate epimerase [Sporosarcina sp. NCCP-2222]|uniref:DUF3267 domain-containing protein n=1 Tax=Sporosarcina sp. NCCP-2222 TaxID=2935073 RepID=UPI00207EEC67|nr:DUF3267 domain-containing protein [Sporosarcina sp. NCCP-2222]GKV57701.1 diaminopimelate epimerase [Sporosarcina sp. NCCP-2222]